MSSEITVGSRVAFLFAVCQAIFLIHDFVQPWDLANFFVWQNCFLFWILAALLASVSEAIMHFFKRLFFPFGKIWNSLYLWAAALELIADPQIAMASVASTTG